MDKTAIVVWIIKSLLGSHNCIVNRCAGTLARAALIGFGVHTATIGDNETHLLAGKAMVGLGVLLGLAHKAWEKYGPAIELRIDAWINRRAIAPPPFPPGGPAALAGLLLCAMMALPAGATATNGISIDDLFGSTNAYMCSVRNGVTNVFHWQRLSTSAVEAPAATDPQDGPRMYMSLSSILESHKGAHANASDYGQFWHAGADYGMFAVEGNMEMPLTKEQGRVRRSLGTDVLFFPEPDWPVVPYLAAGAGYYFGSDMYNTWAVDLGGGIRLSVSRYVYFYVEASILIPFDTVSNQFDRQNEWRRFGAGIGGVY